MPSEHAELGFGGSTAGRTINCPGWADEARKLPPALLNKTSVYAEEGTRLHEEIERVLLGEMEPVSYKVTRGYNALLKLFKEHGVELADINTETRVDLGGIPGAWGTTDFWYEADDGTLVVGDHKFGDGVIVSPEENDQAQFYAIGLIDTVFEPGSFSPDDEVIIVINQPAERLPDDEIISTWKTTVGSLEHWNRRFKEALGRKDLHLGSWCRFCPAQVTCPRMRQTAHEALETDLEDLQPSELSRWLKLARAMEQWASAIESVVHTQLSAGIEIPDFKLVAKRASREWADEDATLQFCKRKRIAMDQYAPRKLVSPAQLEKLIDEVPSYLVTSKSSGTTVVPADDKRPGIQPGLQLAAEILKTRQ